MEFASKIALITGAAGGLGKGFAKALLSRGAKVCLSDINEVEGAKCLESFQQDFSDNVMFVKCDVTSDNSFKNAFEACKQKLGKVNLLVNNAGLGDEQNFEANLLVNLGGTIRGSQLAIDSLSKAGGNEGGHIVNVSSISGVKTVPFGPFYGACKAGIVQYTRNAGHPFHMAYTGVSMQCLCPAFVDTPFLDNASEKAWSPQSARAVEQFMSKIPYMTVDTVVDAFIQLLNEQRPGAAMVVEFDKEPFYVESSI